MCTLTFIPRQEGYLLAMNRDERTARGAAEPPVRMDAGGVDAIYPRDIEGGTWIAANGRGVALALLNRNDVARNEDKSRSRGELIPALVGSCSIQDAQAKVDRLDLTGILPFRLVGIFPAEKRISEWRWDQQSLESYPLSWEERHWFSSSLSDEQASLHRGAACDEAWNDRDAGTVAWLRKLHACHGVTRGPFSICVHRESVRTVSYTELICTAETVQCNYFGRSPCAMREFEHCVEIERAACPAR